MRQRMTNGLGTKTAVLSCAVALGLSLGAPMASAADDSGAGAKTDASTEAAMTGSITDAESADAKMEAQELVNDAVNSAGQMMKDEKLAGLLKQAKGVYIVPEFGKAAAVVGGQGGAGVLLVRKDGEWTDPAFYNFGGITVGAQAGASGGTVAFLLMTDEAVNAFKTGNKLALNAEAGFTVVNYSKAAAGTLGDADVIGWSDTKGLFAGASVGVTNINWDDDSNRSYYGPEADLSDIIAGKAQNDDADELKAALPG
jgi:SH3 domain-containing YSC84-like protein 1